MNGYQQLPSIARGHCEPSYIWYFAFLPGFRKAAGKQRHPQRRTGLCQARDEPERAEVDGRHEATVCTNQLQRPDRLVCVTTFVYFTLPSHTRLAKVPFQGLMRRWTLLMVCCCYDDETVGFGRIFFHGVQQWCWNYYFTNSKPREKRFSSKISIGKYQISKPRASKTPLPPSTPWVKPKRLSLSNAWSA